MTHAASRCPGGCVVPVITPLRADGQVDQDGLLLLLRRIGAAVVAVSWPAPPVWAPCCATRIGRPWWSGPASRYIPAPANCCTGTFVAAWQAVTNHTDLDRHQQAVDAAWDALVGTGTDWVSGCTWALAQDGIGSGRSMHGYGQPDAHKQEHIRTFLATKPIR
ncbi:MAG: hypothetical protein ACOCXA_04125 [Planctomycetota bacterium]